jgi:hypothetical protein
VDKEVQVAELPDQIQLPDLSQKKKIKKQNASITNHKITQSHTTPINMNCFQVLHKKNLTKKIPHLPTNDGRCGYN